MNITGQGIDFEGMRQNETLNFTVCSPNNFYQNLLCFYSINKSVILL